MLQGLGMYFGLLHWSGLCRHHTCKSALASYWKMLEFVTVYVAWQDTGLVWKYEFYIGFTSIYNILGIANCLAVAGYGTDLTDLWKYFIIYVKTNPASQKLQATKKEAQANQHNSNINHISAANILLFKAEGGSHKRLHVYHI